MRQPRANAAEGALALVVALADELEREKISYCHWKSNAAIDRSESGDNDLDLLIARRDAQAFFAAAARQGFVSARPPRSRDVPSVHDLYAVDPVSHKVVHLHAHLQMVVGDDMTKNYRLPIEDAYLQSVGFERLLPLPAVDFEYVVFVLRMTIKYAPLDSRLSRRHRLSEAETAELAFLRARMTADTVAHIVSTHLPEVGVALFAQCERVIDRPGAVRSRARAAWRLQRALSAHARRPALADTALKLARRAHWIGFGRKRKGRYKKRPVSGGLMIAVVGGDGSGKSTLVRGLSESLRAKFVVSTIHLGKPSKGLVTRSARQILGLGRRVGLFRNVYAGSHETAAQPTRFPGYAWLGWNTAVARDRRRAYRRARRAVARGDLVLCDRFPLAELRSADGSRTAPLAIDNWPRRARVLARYERRLYAGIRPAELAFVLRVDPRTAVSRRPEQDEQFVQRRNAEIWVRDWDSSPSFVVLDASAPAASVLRQALDVIWRTL
ncbi:MAG TPA: hypothetical protein VM282_26985 [Acidimicrobiales bacterium]|nr:hypothetical protein [Acidimicrobiales bacterium]